MRQFDQTALQEFLKRAHGSSEPPHELAAPDGSRLVFERAPRPGVLDALIYYDADGAALQLSTQYAPAPARPSGYPAYLPFIPDRAVSLGRIDATSDSVTLTWEELDAPSALAAELVQLSVADGWRELEPAGGALRGAIATGALGFLRVMLGTEAGFHRLVRGERQRYVHVMGMRDRAGLVTLSEVPSRSTRRSAPSETTEL